MTRSSPSCQPHLYEAYTLALDRWFVVHAWCTTGAGLVRRGEAKRARVAARGRETPTSVQNAVRDEACMPAPLPWCVWRGLRGFVQSVVGLSAVACTSSGSSRLGRRHVA